LKTRASIGFSVTILWIGAAVVQADLARLPGAEVLANAKPSSNSTTQLNRLAPSYTLSFLASVGTEQSRQIIAEQTAGAVHLTGDQIFYAPLTVVEATPGDGMGPGGDDSVDTNPPPTPITPVKVPAPGALGLGLVGMVFFCHWRRSIG